MLRNYLKIAFRNLWKNKAFSAMNVIGLASGLAVCLLIVLYVTDEWSYDRYNKTADRIYRLDADIYFNNTSAIFATAPDPLALTLKKECPLVENMTRINYAKDLLVKKDDQNVQDHQAAFVDSTFFEVFTIPMLAGNPATALREPNSVVIDETTARKYFNSTDVLGKTLIIDNGKTASKITGVIKDIPRQSHFHFHFLRLRGKDNDSWLSNNTYNFILARPGVSRKALQKQVNVVVDKYIGRDLQQQMRISLSDLQQKGNHFVYHLMPLTDIHLHSVNKQYEIEANGNVTHVYIFSVIALLIVLIACVNFMNLSTARSANRAKEVGIRKVAGSLRSNLIAQFLTESVLISSFSLLLAIGLAAALLPLFNELAGKTMSVATFFSTWLFPVMLALVVIVGIIAGSYPAFYLSSFQPSQVLKGKVARGFRNSWLRSTLVVVQFTISIGLIVGTIVIYNQLNYIRNKNVGFNRDQILVVHNIYNLDKNRKLFRDQVAVLPGVVNATEGDVPVGGSFDSEGWFRDANFDATHAVVLTNFYVDEQYVPTLGMQMKEGRNFSKQYPTDSNGVILNEAAVKVLGFKDPFRETLYRPSFHPDGTITPAPFHVIGIVKDFNFNSLHQAVTPLAIGLSDQYQTLALRAHGKDLRQVVTALEEKWKALAPGQPFNYTFLDEDFNNTYKAEQETGKLFVTFAIFAIFIGCLGLFGLVTYAAEQRTKEIGVRKVLGASVTGIVAMLSADFAKLLLISSLVAFPLAWWLMTRWLQNFAYRTTIDWWIFALAALIATLIALVTVSLKAIKAATANPVKSLRTE
ncbi:MAG: ABC transporter permease [Bacteroidota bacterium]|nr:ABC transporter permease [Bacteroidota bacterium]MDP4216790.1 ABC transporter permease [Bacteroidota bacterium]MDP4245353.1 ABC transporter permease [Bacteroidota bacterium]MDP4252630.1 ABC transporter permease [Bacteroidota bacterium]MDP4258495.1 ABC transporter permease [Bacteroidota bacterium]